VGRRNIKSPEEQVSPVHAIARARDLVAALLCLAPPLFLSNRLPTLHTVTDSKWLVVVFLAAVEIALIALVAATRPAEPRRRHPFLIRALLVGTAVLAITHLLSASVSHAPGFSLRATIPSLSLIVLFGAMISQPCHPGNIRKLIVLTITTGALVGACAVSQHLGFDPLASLVRYREADSLRTGVYVTLANPEFLGGYLAPLAVASLGVAIASVGRRARSAALAAAILTFVPALLSGSRGAFLGMAAGAVVLLIGILIVAPRPSRRARIGWLVAAAAIVALFAAALFSSQREGSIGLLRARLADMADSHSDSVRRRIVFNLVGAEMVANHPVLGIGPGMFGVEFYPALLHLGRDNRDASMGVIARDFNGTVAEHAHNDWLEFWAETGTLGFAAWLAIVVLWATVIIRALVRRPTGTGEPLLALALASVVIALLVNALFNFPLHEPVRATLFWLALAWSASLASVNRSCPMESQNSGKKGLSAARRQCLISRD
jgi:O-antigen ligase